MAPIDPSHAAVRGAMNELQLTIKSERRKRHGVTLVGQSPGGPKVRVSLSQISPIATKFEIRVGVFGDQAVSQLTMDGIDRFLQPPEPLQSPIEPAACADTGPIDPDRAASVSD